MHPEYRPAVRTDRPALRALWKQAFQDSEDFLDRFFETAFAPDRSRVAVINGTIVAALYWFPCTCRRQSLAYLYAVATDEAHRRQGLCSGLLADTRRHLIELGFAGILLVPGSAGLFQLYGRMGYIPCCPQGRITAAAAGPALPLKPVSPRRYGELRQELLPPGSVLQEGPGLEFQAGLSRLYAGKELLLAAARQDDGSILAQELLCRDPIAAAPRILKTLKADTGIFRVPYAKGRPFAMFLPLPAWQGPAPHYFAFAYD